MIFTMLTISSPTGHKNNINLLTEIQFRLKNECNVNIYIDL
jgi:hypothetical protein